MSNTARTVVAFRPYVEDCPPYMLGTSAQDYLAELFAAQVDPEAARRKVVVRATRRNPVDAQEQEALRRYLAALALAVDPAFVLAADAVEGDVAARFEPEAIADLMRHLLVRVDQASAFGQTPRSVEYAWLDNHGLFCHNLLNIVRPAQVAPAGTQDDDEAMSDSEDASEEVVYYASDEDPNDVFGPPGSPCYVSSDDDEVVELALPADGPPPLLPHRKAFVDAMNAEIRQNYADDLAGPGFDTYPPLLACRYGLPMHWCHQAPVDPVAPVTVQVAPAKPKDDTPGFFSDEQVHRLLPPLLTRYDDIFDSPL